MAAKKYTSASGKSITFPEKFDLTLEQFREQFGENHIFNEYKPKEREIELKKAFKIATTKAEAKPEESK